MNFRSAYVTSSLVISVKVTGEFKSLVDPTGEAGIKVLAEIIRTVSVIGR